MIRILLLSALLIPATALAQVSIDPNALDKLKPSAPSPTPTAEQKAPPHRAPTRHEPPRHEPPRHEAHAPAHPAPPPAAKPKPRPVTVAPAPPPVPVLPPITPAVQPKPATSAAPPPVPIVADAEGSFSALPGGARITFGAGKSDLNQTTLDAIRAVAGQVKDDPNADVNVYAYAAAVADDPSTPRRLALARALAARAVLISEGIASTRIYVRAFGPTSTEGPPDRVDVIRSGFPIPGGPAGSAAATPPAGPPPTATPPAAAAAPAPPAATPAPAPPTQTHRTTPAVRLDSPQATPQGTSP